MRKTVREQEEHFKKIREKFDSSKIHFQKMEGKSKGIFSLTLQVGLSSETRKEIGKLLKKLRKLDPNQKYRKLHDLHITLKWLPPENSKVKINSYIEKAARVLEKKERFEVSLKGVNFSSNVSFIQVFSSDNKILEIHKNLCAKLPKVFPKFESQNFTPHVAILYFDSEPSNIINFLKSYKSTNFGKVEIKKIDLLKWDYETGKKKVLKSFKLR